MNTNYKTLNRVPTEFEAETQFELRPAASAAYRAAQETEFERLKSRLLNRELAEAATPSAKASSLHVPSPAPAAASVPSRPSRSNSSPVM